MSNPNPIPPRGRGRPKGSRNKRAAAVEAAVANGGITPLEYMLTLLRADTSSPEDRKWAAQNAAPYVHAKLSAAEVKMDANVQIAETVATAEELRAKLRQ